MFTTQEVFVTTYAIGNTKGFATGKWFDLSDYDDKQDFLDDALAYAKEYLGDSDPELCFSDYNGIPTGAVSEYHINGGVFAFAKLSEYEKETVNAYLNATGCDLTCEVVEKALECHIGKFDSFYDLGEHLACELGCFDIPEHIQPYFDFESYGRDVSFDLIDNGEHYFFNQ